MDEHISPSKVVVHADEQFSPDGPQPKKILEKFVRFIGLIISEGMGGPCDGNGFGL
jgi:hypothetical protein